METQYAAMDFETAKSLFHFVVNIPLAVGTCIIFKGDTYRVVEIAHTLNTNGYEVTTTSVFVKKLVI